jgi:HAMP domain-containing protein
LRLREGEVSEVAVPILEGQIGAVRLGIWRDAVDAEAFQTVMPLIKIIALVIAGGIVLVVVLAWRINRPILRLVNTARSISRGDLDTPSLGLEGATEFGELSRALERMRSSVKAAMIRLSQEL